MRFTIEDAVRNRVTEQEAPVVRIADTSVGVVYVVSIPRGDTTIEVLWRESEVK